MDFILLRQSKKGTGSVTSKLGKKLWRNLNKHVSNFKLLLNSLTNDSKCFTYFSPPNSVSQIPNFCLWDLKKF